MKREERGVLVTPESGPLAGGGRRTASSSMGSLGALRGGFVGQKREEGVGYKRDRKSVV